MAFSHVLALVPAAVTWAGKEEQEVSPLALSQNEGQRKVGALLSVCIAAAAAAAAAAAYTMRFSQQAC